MRTYIVQIADKTVHLTCEEKLENAVRSLAEVIAQLNSQKDIFNEDFTLCAGWSYYYFKQEEDYWDILAPDFHRDPHNTRTNNLTIPLMVQNLQSEAMHTAGIQVVPGTMPITFKHKMLVLKDALTAKDVYFSRSEPENADDSGWYLGIMGDDESQHEPDDYAEIQTCELLKFRPLSVRILCMPVGTLAVFDGNKMTALVDKDNNPLKFSTDGNENKGRTETNV